MLSGEYPSVRSPNWKMVLKIDKGSGAVIILAIKLA